MVEENFKIGIEIDVDQDSLANITKQVNKAIQQAIQGGSVKAARGAKTTPPAVGSATARSAREATSASSADFTKAVNQLARENKINADKIDSASASLTEAMNRLSRQLARQPAGGGGVTASQTAKIVAQQVGPTNKNLAKDIKMGREDGGRRPSSGGTSERKSDLRTGTKRDQPASQKRSEELKAARPGSGSGPTAPHPQQRYAEARAKAVAASIDKLGSDITGSGALGNIPKLLERIGLPTGGAVQQGAGASVEIKALSGTTKTVTGYLKIVGKDLTVFSDIVTKRIQDLMSGPKYASEIEKASRQARRGPQGEEIAVAKLRSLIKGLLDLPSINQGGALAYEKGGEALLEIELDPQLQKELSELGTDEAAQVALLNKRLWEMNDVMKELRKQGGEVIGSVGLGEETAAKTNLIKNDRGLIEKIQMPVQLRDLAGMNLGGRGGQRWARSFQPTQARPMVHGELPQVMGKGEAQAYQTGMFDQKSARNLRTAYLDPTKVPEVHEDQILLSRAAAAMMDTKVQKPGQIMKEAAPGLEVGQALTQGQVIGTDIEGGDIKFDLKGAEAKILEIIPVIKDGIEGVRVRYEELHKMVTGSKMTTLSGFKGVARVEDDLTKFGAPEGAEVAISAVGAAKRGILSDPMKMMASEIGEAAGVEAQQVANVIEEAMTTGGQKFGQAIKMVAEQFGLKGFTGGTGGAMTGNLPWLRMKEPREPGAAEIGTRYIDKAGMGALSMRAGTDKMAEDMKARMKQVTDSQAEYIATIFSVAGASDVASESLGQMLPEDFAKLPAGVGAMESFAGTLLDPKFQQAMAIRMPERGGGESLFRMPSQGPGLAQRGGFTTDLGAMGSDEITRQLDAVMQAARKVRVAEGNAVPDLGELDPASEDFKDVSYRTAEAIRLQVKEIEALGTKTEEGAAAAEDFVAKFMPLIEGLKLTEEMAFYKTGPEGDRLRKVPAAKKGAGKEGALASGYIEAAKDSRGQMLRMQEVLRGRAATKGRGYENIPTGGEIRKDAELLQKVMDTLGITLEQDADAVEKLYIHLEKMKTTLIKMVAATAIATPSGGKPGTEMKRPLAEQIGAGLGVGHKELTAVQFRTDITDELAYVEKNIEAMGEHAGAAATRMKEAQGDVAKIPRDVVYLHKKDWDNLVNATMKEAGIGRDAAESRMRRPGLLHRFPTTGGGSFLATRARPDPTGTLEPGNIGVAGPAAVSSQEDLNAVRSGLMDFKASLEKTISANEGMGPAAEKARAELINLIPTLHKLDQLYLATALNLDFDGDRISWLADMATAAGSGIETFTQRIERGGVSFQEMMLKTLGGVQGGGAEDADAYGQLIKSVRKIGPRRAILSPETGEMAQAEAQAHIGGKKSVGLLTDLFNKVELAVLNGSGQVGDAFATWIDMIMLNINKSLAQKSGGGGVAGPLEFLEDLKGGQLDKIFEEMRAEGSGVTGELGSHNRKMRAEMTGQLTDAFNVGGPEALRGVAQAEGIGDILPEDINAKNFSSVIESMVNELDLESAIKRMFDMMKKNMVQALAQQGMGGAEIEKTIKRMLSPGKGGKIWGLDLNEMLGQLAPEYMGTRQKQIGQMREAPAMDTAQQVMQLLEQHIIGQVSRVTDDFDLEDGFDPRAKAREIVDTVENLFEQAKQGFGIVERQGDFASLMGGRYTEKQVEHVKGGFRPDPTGGPGRIFMSGKHRIQPLIEALSRLKEIAEGAPTTASELDKLAQSILQFGATLSHEKIHQANKTPFGLENRAKLVRDFQSPETAVGQDFEKITGAFNSFNISKLKKDVDEWQEVAMAAGNPDLPELDTAKRKLYNQVAEESLASQANPEAFMKMMKAAGVSKEAILELNDSFFTLVTGLSDLDETVVQDAVVTRKAAAEIKSLSGALGEVGSVSRGVNEDLRQLESTMGQKFVGGIQSANEKLTLQEAAVMQGTDLNRLPTVGRGEGRLGFTEDISKTGVEGQFSLLSGNIRDVMERARGGFGDAGQVNEAEREMERYANDLRSVMASMEKEPESGVAAGTGQRVFQKTMREFHQAVSLDFINKARGIQRVIGEMRASGESERDPGKLRDLLKELNMVIAEHEEYLARSLRPRGPGLGTSTSHITDEMGNLVPAAQEAGIEPSEKVLEARLKSIGGRGQAGKEFMGTIGQSVKGAAEQLMSGVDLTKVWTKLFSELTQQPEEFSANLVRVIEMLGAIARHAGFIHGRFSNASESVIALVGHVKALQRETSGKTIKSAEDLSQVISAGPKKTKQAFAAGKGGGELVESIKQQYKEAERVAEDRRKRLQELISDPEAYKLTGRPKTFQTKTIDIIDPNTGEVFQKIAIEAKRMGKTVQVSMRNASNASSQLGNQMRSALRRVVQWGFASGVVYGLVRAFRNAVQVITEVQDKMMQLQKVMDTTVTDFIAMQDAAVGMAQEFGVSISDVLDGMVVYGQQGLKMNKILERTEATMLAVNVTTLSSVEATEALTAAHKVFHDSVSGSSEFVDAWGAVAAKHAITAADLADAVKRSGAAADVAGVGFEDFMGIVTAIGAVTRQTGKEIATSTKFMFRAMRRPTAQKELGKIGIKSLMPGTGDLRPAMGILNDVADTWGNLTRAQQINIAQAMAGIRHYNSFIVLMKNFDEVLLASIDAQNSQGFASRKNALAMQTFSKQIQVLSETVKKMALELGKSVLPVATGLVKIMSSLVEVVNKLPGALLSGVTAFSALGLAAVKTADLVVDSLDAMFGGHIGEKVKGQGLIKTSGLAIKDLARGFKPPSAEEDDFDFYDPKPKLGKLGRLAAKSRAGVTKFGSGILKLTGAFAGLIPFLGSAGAAIASLGTTAALVAGSAGILALTLGLYGAYAAYKAFTAGGKETAKELEEQIGKSHDYTMQLKNVSTHLTRVSLAFKKVESAMNNIGDTDKLREALNSRSFQSAAVAARTFTDTMVDASQAIAMIDPGTITGIDEFGNYVVGLDAGFKNLALSAADAQNAITSALQTKVLTAFAKDLKEPVGFLDRISAFFKKGLQKVTGMEVSDMSPTGKLLETEKELKKLIDDRNAAAAEGLLSRADTEAKIVELTQEKAQLEEQVLATSMEIKKVMEAMPAFEDMGMAQTMLGSDMAKAIEAAVPSGVFGRGATTSSVMQKQLAKSAGTGGLFDYRDAANPAALAGSLMERGILPTTGKEATGIDAMGEIAVAGPEVAKAIVERLALGLSGADLSEVERAAQSLQSAVSRTTGEDIWTFWDSINQTWQEVTPQQVTDIIGAVDAELADLGWEIAAVWQKFTRESMEQAAAETERILNLGFVGALGGIRMPKGGMPDIGAGRNIELSSEQRALKTIALDMERLGEIQNEMNQITKEYSETVLHDVEGAYKGQAKSGQALKVLTADMVTLVTQLQEEAFNLAIIGHYQKAIEELGLSMEQAAEAARDARIEEDARNKYLVETSGALAGMSAIPNLDFGKTFKETTSAEKLALGVPGFKGALDNMQRSTREREAAVQQIAEVKKQRANFDQVVASLKEAGDTLSGAQRNKILDRAAQGVSLETIESIKVMEEGNRATQDILGVQVGLEEKMLAALYDLIKVTAGDDKAREQVMGGLKAAKTAEGATQQLKAFGSVAGGGAVKRVLMETFGLKRDKTQEGGGRYEMSDAEPRFYKSMTDEQKATFNALREDYAQVVNAGIDLQRNPSSMRHLSMKSTGDNKLLTNQSEVQTAQAELRDLLLSIIPVSEDLSRNIGDELRDPASKIKDDDSGKKHFDTLERIKEDIRLKEIEAYRRFHDAELKIIAGVEQSSRELLAKEPARLAIAARDFATSLDDMILGFKKTQMLDYNKIDSDLEGPWARVGQPDFKNKFEQRREELEAGSTRPRSMEEYRQRQKDLDQLEFDEKEAKIVQKQDIETKNLRTQQSQAESFRSTLFDALNSGQLEGSGLEGGAERLIKTLGQELAESEQAWVKGGDLFYRGVPSLEKATKLAAQAKQIAKEQAAKAIYHPITTKQDEQTQYLKSIDATLKREASGSLALPPGAMKGMPAVGRTAQNIMADIQARREYGNATATTSNTISTSGGASPGSQNDRREREFNRPEAPRGAILDGGLGKVMKESFDKLGDKVDVVVERLAPVTELGSKIDGTTAAVEGIQDGLNVNITGGSVEISNASEIGDAIDGGLGNLGSAVSEGVTRISALETLVGEESVEGAKTIAEEAKIIAETAEDTAEAAEETANDASEAVRTVSTGLADEKIARENADRALESSIDRMEDGERVIMADVKQVKKVSTRADENAKRALNGIRRP